MKDYFSKGQLRLPNQRTLRCFFSRVDSVWAINIFKRGGWRSLSPSSKEISCPAIWKHPFFSQWQEKPWLCHIILPFSKSQLLTLTRLEPRDMKRPSQKNRVTVQSCRTFQRSSLTSTADNNNDCLWLQNTLPFPLRSPHLRSPPPPAHIHTQTVARTHICSNNGRLCLWPPQAFCLSIAWLYHQPNTHLLIVHSHTQTAVW